MDTSSRFITELREKLWAAANPLMAFALAIVAVLALFSSVPDEGREPDALAYLLALVLTLPLAVRNKSPLGVLSVRQVHQQLSVGWIGNVDVSVQIV